ncbi:MAG: cohesin domain-containing protein [Candidatus Aminicenantales bacterium]
MRKTLLLGVVLLTLWGCETFSQNYKLGTQAAMSKDWEEAVKYFERALWENPKNSVYRLALFRAKRAASFFYLQEARRLAAQKKKEEALEMYKKAYSFDPLNRDIVEEAKLLMKEEKKGKPKNRTPKIEPPVKLKVPKEKVELKFVSATLRTIFQTLGKSAGVNILFDEQFRDVPMSITLKDMNFEEALSALCMASKNFYRVVDERTIIVAPDQPLKRAQYELNAIKTFYLSNINAQEIQGQLAQMLRTQFRAPSIIVDKNLNTLTIRDTPANIELAEKILRKWDKSKAEVVIDLEIMEVSRLKLRQLGLDFDAYTIGFRYEGGTEGWVNLQDLDFTKLANFAISLPISLIDILESDADTKIIAQPRLRGIEGEDMEYTVGDRVPIPRTTFTPIAAGGVSQQPITSFQYEDVGLGLKIKPKVHHEKEITLELEMKITSLGGKGYADIPIISTREVKNTIRLKDGETNLLAGLLRDEERKTLKGIAVLKNIPVIGSLFANTDQQIQQTDVILTITPYIIRTVPIDEEDREPVWIGLDGFSAAPAEAQLPRPEEEAVEERLRRERRAEEARLFEEKERNQIFLAPADFQTRQNREFRVSIILRTQEEVGNFSLTVGFNSRILELTDVVPGSIIGQLGEEVPFLKNIDNTSGVATIGFSSPDVSKGIKGAGRVATLVFKAKEAGEGNISLSAVSANRPTGESVSFVTNDSHIVVK